MFFDGFGGFDPHDAPFFNGVLGAGVGIAMGRRGRERRGAVSQGSASEVPDVAGMQFRLRLS